MKCERCGGDGVSWYCAACSDPDAIKAHDAEALAAQEEYERARASEIAGLVILTCVHTGGASACEACIAEAIYRSIKATIAVAMRRS